MIAKRADGQSVDLSKPENVKAGMVFRLADGREGAAACDGQLGVPPGAGHFLGCHPGFAAREDCERFGIPLRCQQHGVPDVPFDAGAYGFARTRDGFAVDLRKSSDHLPPGTVFAVPSGKRTVCGRGANAPLLEDERFVGLNARHARPGDVERLCCGRRDETKPYPIPGMGMRDTVCTLAIGQHAEHEDLATGTRWPAEKPLLAPNIYEETLRFVDQQFAKALLGRTFVETPFPSTPVPDPRLQTLRVGGRAYACLVTERPRRRRRHLGEYIDGPRRRLVSARDRNEVWEACERSAVFELVEQAGVTCMLAVGWTRRQHADVQDTSDLEVEFLEAVGFDVVPCAACGVAMEPGTDRAPVAIDVPNKNADDNPRRFTVCRPCAVKLNGAEVAHKNGRLAWHQCPRCKEPVPKESRSSWCSNTCAMAHIQDMVRAGKIDHDKVQRLMGAFDARARVGFGDVGALCTVYEDGATSCSCGKPGEPAIHKGDCRVEPWARSAAEILAAAAKAASSFESAQGAAAAVVLGRWLRSVWDATPAGQLVARDAAVAKAIADVPEGCDPGGWANVVRVLAADNWDGPYPRATARNRAGFPQHLHEEVADIRQSIASYARARFVFGYSPAEALRWVLEAEGGEEAEPGAIKLAERLIAAYETGR
jgi:hypothetical protein